MTWQEACIIFGINADASPQEIKERYNNLAQITHPDKHNQGSEKTKKTAEEQFKRIQQAYDVLQNPGNRQSAGANRSSRTASNLLEIYPAIVSFRDVEPLDVQHGSFEIRYRGQAQEISIDRSMLTFVTVIRCDQITQNSKFPLKVEFQAIGNNANQLYVESVPVCVNGERAEARIELQTKRSVKADQFTSGITPGANWYRLGFTAAAVFLGIGLGYYFDVAFLSIVSAIIIWLIEIFALIIFWPVKSMRIIVLILSVIPIFSTLAVNTPGFPVFQVFPMLRGFITRVNSAAGGAVLAGLLTYFVFADLLSRSKYKTFLVSISLVIAVITMVLGIKLAL